MTRDAYREMTKPTNPRVIAARKRLERRSWIRFMAKLQKARVRPRPVVFA